MRISGMNYLTDEMGGVEVETFTKSNFLKIKYKNWGGKGSLRLLNVNK